MDQAPEYGYQKVNEHDTRDDDVGAEEEKGDDGVGRTEGVLKGVLQVQVCVIHAVVCLACKGGRMQLQVEWKSTREVWVGILEPFGSNQFL